MWAWLLLSRSIYGAMVKCLGCWIRDPVAFGLILLGGSKVESAFHSSEDDKMSTRNSWGNSGYEQSVLLQWLCGLKTTEPYS